jgi:predicted acetyltransferase
MAHREIRPLEGGDFDSFMALTLRAYPRFGMPFEERGVGFEEEIRRQFKDPTIEPVGSFVDGTLAGVMRIFRFDMNFYGTVVPVRGLGSVAVDLPFKKQHLAKEMVEHFHESARGDGCFLTALYPFAPPFYRKMGYGYGGRLDRYQIRLSSLAKMRSARRVAYLSRESLPALHACYRRVYGGRHGVFDRLETQMETLLGDGVRRLLVGVPGDREDEITGYAAFHFVRGYNGGPGQDNLYLNDIYVDEMVYDSPEALRELLAFFGRQADQARHLILQTPDPSFYHLLEDPRDASENVIEPAYHQSAVTGVGLMYRLVDVPRGLGAYAAARPGVAGPEGDRNRPVPAITLAVTDNFVPENAGRYVLGPDAGAGRDAGTDAATRSAETPAILSIDVSALSSLVMGAVSIGELLDLGLGELSDPAARPAVEGLFPRGPGPICYTGF